MKQDHFALAARLLPLFILIILFCGCSSASSILADSGQQQSGLSPLLTFALFGDNQIGYAAWQETKVENPSSANIPQMRQTLVDIANTSPRPELLFIPGDLVMNEAIDEGQTLRVQLDAWQEVYESIPETATIPMLPMPGNHELVLFDPVIDDETPNPGAIDVWLEWLGKNSYNRFAGNGPVPSGSNPDHLARDESSLTYSFDRGAVHFVIINSDTLNTEKDSRTGLVPEGWIPINWIEKDIRQAQKDPLISMIIVLSHKPIEPPPYAPINEHNNIIDTPEYPFAERLSQVMRENSKVELFITSHSHSWHAFRLEGGRGVWQILVGDGGAPLDAQWNPEGGVYYGYTIVSILWNRSIVVEGYGRPLPPPPQKFYEGSPAPPDPATLRSMIVIQE